MKYRRTPQFREDLEALPDDIRVKIGKAFRLFQDNPRHPSLQVHKIKGANTRDGLAIWEGRIDKSYRFTFHHDGDIVWFRRIGPHSIIEADRE